MPDVGQIERKTQERLVEFFSKKLGYEYLGNWETRENNSNIEEELLIKFLKRQKYSDILINKALHELKRDALNQSKGLYDLNKDTYSILRYGVKVKETIGENKETLHFINWKSF
jgi:type I restriction enzyme R subunit